MSRQDEGAGVTHVIVEPDAVDHIPPQLLPTGGGKRSGSKPPPALVTAEWLAACLAQRCRASEVPFTVVAGAPRGARRPPTHKQVIGADVLQVLPDSVASPSTMQLVRQIVPHSGIMHLPRHERISKSESCLVVLLPALSVFLRCRTSHS